MIRNLAIHKSFKNKIIWSCKYNTCINVSDDHTCDRKGGECKMTKKRCDGYWTTGDCAGPADRKCCISMYIDL